MQHARQRNAKVLIGIVKDFRKGRENTFLSSVRGGGKNRLSAAGRDTYTLLDYIALSFPSSKSAHKGQGIKHEILALNNN